MRPALSMGKPDFRNQSRASDAFSFCANNNSLMDMARIVKSRSTVLVQQKKPSKVG